MNHGRWTSEQEEFIRANVGKMTHKQMAAHLGKSTLAIRLFIHRRQLHARSSIKRNLAKEILRVKFRHPENFSPSRNFYATTGLTQQRWWALYRGEKPITEHEYLAISQYFGLTLEEAFEARQLSLFEESND